MPRLVWPVPASIMSRAWSVIRRPPEPWPRRAFPCSSGMFGPSTIADSAPLTRCGRLRHASRVALRGGGTGRPTLVMGGPGRSPCSMRFDRRGSWPKTSWDGPSTRATAPPGQVRRPTASGAAGSTKCSRRFGVGSRSCPSGVSMPPTSAFPSTVGAFWSSRAPSQSALPVGRTGVRWITTPWRAASGPGSRCARPSATRCSIQRRATPALATPAMARTDGPATSLGEPTYQRRR